MDIKSWAVDRDTSDLFITGTTVILELTPYDWCLSKTSLLKTVKRYLRDNLFCITEDLDELADKHLPFVKDHILKSASTLDGVKGTNGNITLCFYLDTSKLSFASLEDGTEVVKEEDKIYFEGVWRKVYTVKGEEHIKVKGQRVYLAH